ncbi:iron efflux ABC transporter ATP-binding subunit FetA [Erwinia tasmaniensis]|uniref:ABC transporter ATP-binding protein n=1 Tax=Erwinia tasmaniensis (strain DSM 17950 / CFBP 7177 / CIP 109463 / NCPPB 4357 / Et1/99) TaxID=465817 RepID=B2VBI4_ERWT9|nr:ATP-binding cassette domain-containing protein [Erwinia tasmaniensis]CAO97422.1 Putative ABC transporter ATP-binding protein [Erwinia tasmaniensis Et1/99]
MNAPFPLLQVREASFIQQGKRLLAPVSLTLNKGELLWLTGPSGAGKSTLLKIIASLLNPSSGDVCLNGQRASGIKAEIWRQSVSYVFQTPQLFGRTVFDNLAFPYEIRQQPVERRKLYDWLEKLNLSAEMLDKPVDQLSGGEKQRVALLRNVQFSPQILLLDEVTSALDDANKQAVQQLIEQQLQQGVAAIWISHDGHQISSRHRVLTLAPVANRRDDGSA